MAISRLALGLTAALLANAGHAIDPAPDPMFGAEGTAVLSYGELGGQFGSLAIQPDGKPVVGGNYGIPFGGFAAFGVQGFLDRLTADGEVDTTLFGGTIVQYETPQVLVDAQARIYTGRSPLLARYLPDGQLDHPYTHAAAATTEALGGGFKLERFALQAEGKVVAGGHVGAVLPDGEGVQAVEILRFDATGALDVGFGTEGRARIPLSTGSESLSGIVALPEGKTAVAITHANPVGTSIFRLDADGRPDTSFGVQGRLPGPPDVVAIDLAVQSDGALLLVTGAAGPVVHVTRFRSNGSTDTLFGVGGLIAKHAGVFQSRLVIRADDSLVLATNRPAEVTAYFKDGTPDLSFGEQGTLALASLRALNAMALGPDGSLWLAGESAKPAPSAGVNRGEPAVVHLVSRTTPVVEFHHATLDHYFITINPRESSALDLGWSAGWTRTQEAFNLLAPSSPSKDAAAPVCRFYIPPAQGDSHFFSVSVGECDATAIRFPAFTLETPEAMRAGLPNERTGACPADWPVAVYRVWNGRIDSNHRYTARRETREAMLARGWIAEGYGLDAIALCAGPDAP